MSVIEAKGSGNGNGLGVLSTSPNVDTPDVVENFEPNLSTWQMVSLSISLSFGLFLSLLDTTIVATALFTIGVDLKSLNSVNWVALAYTLAYLGCAVIFARIADVVGRRNAYISAYVIFLSFSLGCGFSRTLNQLIATRVLQGIGGSGLYSLTFVLIPELFPVKQAQWVSGGIGAVLTMSGVLGPVLGGTITNYTTWRWIFWINGPIGIGPLILLVVVWPKPHKLQPVQKVSIKNLDFVGCVLIIAASVLVVFALEQAGLDTVVWHKAIFLAPIIVGSICWLLLFIWEFVVARFWEDTMLAIFPVRLMKRRVYMAYVFSGMLIGFPFYTVIYALPLRLQVVNGKSPLIAGVAILPMLCSSAVGSVIGGAVNGKKNNTYISLFAGSSLMMLATGLFSTLAPSVKIPPSLYGFQVLAGLGAGLCISTVSLGVIMECSIRDTTVAQGIIAQVRVVGGSIGIAASSTILGIIQRRDLAGVVTSTQIATLRVSANTLTEEQLQAIRKVYSDSFRVDMRATTIVSGLAVLAALAAYKKDRRGLKELQKERTMEERDRLRALQAKSRAKHKKEGCPDAAIEAVA